MWPHFGQITQTTRNCPFLASKPCMGLEMRIRYSASREMSSPEDDSESSLSNGRIGDVKRKRRIEAGVKRLA